VTFLTNKMMIFNGLKSASVCSRWEESWLQSVKTTDSDTIDQFVLGHGCFDVDGMFSLLVQL